MAVALVISAFVIFLLVRYCTDEIIRIIRAIKGEE